MVPAVARLQGGSEPTPMPRSAAGSPIMGGMANDLVERFRAGDRRAQREIVERLLPRLRRTIRVLVRQPQDLEDAVQLCIIDILRASAGFRGESTIETWAHRIAVRRALKVQSKRRLSIARSDAATDPTELPTPAGEGTSLGDRLPRPVTAYLDEVSDVQRQAIVLHHAWGYSLREIAELTDTSANTVKARLFHGLRRIRQLIAEDMESEQ